MKESSSTMNFLIDLGDVTMGDTEAMQSVDEAVSEANVFLFIVGSKPGEKIALNISESSYFKQLLGNISSISINEMLNEYFNRISNED